MTSLHRRAATSIVALVLLQGLPTAAGEGHDHGRAAPAAAGTALPRFTAVSETFELVGVLDGKLITLYLDRFADNTPVRGAQIELEIAGVTSRAAAHGEDAYEVLLKDAPKPGVLPITVTVTAGAEVDLLAGELDLHAAAHAAEPAHQHSWREYGAWAAGGLLALATLALITRHLVAGRSLRARGAA